MCVGDALGVGHEQQNHCVRDGSYLLAVKGLELERRQGLDVALYTYSLVCALHPAVGRARNHKLDARARAHTHTHTHTCTHKQTHANTHTDTNLYVSSPPPWKAASAAFACPAPVPAFVPEPAVVPASASARLGRHRCEPRAYSTTPCAYTRARVGVLILCEFMVGWCWW